MRLDEALPAGGLMRRGLAADCGDEAKSPQAAISMHSRCTRAGTHQHLHALTLTCGNETKSPQSNVPSSPRETLSASQALNIDDWNARKGEGALKGNSKAIRRQSTARERD